MPRRCGGGFVDLTFQRRQVIYRNGRNTFQAKQLKKFQINFFSMAKLKNLLAIFLFSLGEGAALNLFFALIKGKSRT